MPVAPAALVVGAPRLPLPYGLFSAITLRPSGDRWENGVQWEGGQCLPAGGLPAPDCEAPIVPLDVDLGDDPSVPAVSTASAFTVYGYFRGNPVGFSPEAAQVRATDHLLAREEARAEQAFWTGDLGNEPTLRGAEELATGTAQDLEVGLGLLEQAVVDNYGSLGVIHMTRPAALMGLRKQVIESRNGRLFTALGTPVVAGAGYDGSSPDGDDAAAGQAWSYVTPAVFGYRSEVFAATSVPGDLLDRSTNTLYAVAERSYLLGYDNCGVSAALLKVA